MRPARWRPNIERMHRLSWLGWSRLLFMTLAGVSLVPAALFAADAAPSKLVNKEPKPVKMLLEELAKKPAEKSVPPAKKNKDEKQLVRTVAGSVMFIRKNRMSVEFVSNETGGEDLLLSLDPKVKVKGIKDFSKIKQGDQVQVKYTETYLEPKEKGGEPVVLSRVGTEILFLKPAAPVAQTLETDALASSEGA